MQHGVGVFRTKPPPLMRYLRHFGMQLNLVFSQYFEKYIKIGKVETDDQEGFKKHLMSGVRGNRYFVLL